MRILIIKTGALGDVVRTSFIAQALKDKYIRENPEIYWITEKRAVSFFINSPYVNYVIKEEDKNKVSELNFDLVINLEEDEKNCSFASSLKKRKLIGAFLAKDGKIDYSIEGKYWFDMSRISKLGKIKADIMKKQNRKTHREIICEIIGIKDYKKYEPFLRLNNYQRKFAVNFFRRYNLSKKDFIVGINTGSGERWPKDLSVKKTAELIDKLYKKYDAKILLFGGPNEIERNKEIHKLSRAPIINTGEGNNLVEFPALVSLCNLFITSDTLGLHVALALKRKTIVLLGPTSNAEIDLYNLGEKIVAKSNCLSCYKENCKSMSKINIQEVFNAVEKVLLKKVTLVITAFKEPKTIGKAIDASLKQQIRYNYNVVVSAPDEETLNIARGYAKKNKKIEIFKDPGKGKMLALNLLFKKINSDIIILTDGDVYISDNSVDEICNLFLDPEIGCVTGRPVPMEDKKTKYGYWANFLFDSAHSIRKKAFENNNFIECSGYLFAFRKNVEIEIPLDTAEDTIIPYIFWEKGYKIGYAENAKVFVKNVNNWRDWIKQKVRTSNAHETLDKYVNTSVTKRVKSFKTESSGIYNLLKYPSSLKEVYWSFSLALARLYMWGLVFYNTKIVKFKRIDNWERIESAR